MSINVEEDQLALVFTKLFSFLICSTFADEKYLTVDI